MEDQHKPPERIREMSLITLSLSDLNDKIARTQNTIKASVVDGDTDKIQVQFEVSDRSEGTTITVDSIDKIVYDILDPTKVVIHLS